MTSAMDPSQSNAPPPLRLKSTGSLSGLSVVLVDDFGQHESVNLNNFQGFKVAVQEPFEMAQVARSGFAVQAGDVALMGIDAEHIMRYCNE